MTGTNGATGTVDGSAPTVSVVICCYTTARWEQIVAAVDSALGQVPPPLETVVVVDHCPELERRLRERFGTTLRVETNTGRRGLSGARNSGLAAASGEVVVFLDDDARARPGWLHGHARLYADPSVVGAGGLVVPHWEQGMPRWFPPEFGWVVGCSYTGLPVHTAEVRNPIGANMSFRREALVAAGGFSEELGRVGRHPVGCEETELSIRIARLAPTARILHEPAAVVEHDVPADRSRSAYFWRRCWSEGRSKAKVSSLAGPRRALATERGYVTRTLGTALLTSTTGAVRGRDLWLAARAAALLTGLAVTTAGYAAGRITRRKDTDNKGEHTMTQTTRRHSSPEWIDFDIHGRVGLRVAGAAPAAAQLRTMLACFASQSTVPPDITVSAEPRAVPDAAELEDELAYTPETVTFVQDDVQIVRDGARFEVHGSGELLTPLVPVLDRAMVERGAAMVHAATVAYRGRAILLPAAGGTGKTSTVAKLMRRDGYSFMGDDWAFLADDKNLLGYAKPMFIKPHHRAIYPHLFAGMHKPMVPSSLSRPVGRLTTLVHPVVIRYPRVADFSRRWSPEHRMVRPDQALQGVPVTTSAPLLVAVYVERYGGDVSRLHEVDETWMVDRMMGNFHIEMASFSQKTVTAMAATSMVPWRQYVDDKVDVLHKGLDGVPCYLLQVPSAMSADEASDDVVRFVDGLIPSLLAETAELS